MATASVSAPPGQPDITYTPDFDKYKARTQRRLATEKLEHTLPPGFPSKLESEFVWDGDSIKESGYNWVYELSAEEVAEIEAALENFKSLNLSQGHISPTTFPLPTLHAPLRTLSHLLHHGPGFAVLRGLPVATHTRTDTFTLYAGVSSHIAPIRGRQDQTHNGAPADVVLAHIKDLSTTADAAQIGAPAYTTDKQVFHTDAGDVIALLCLSAAAEGGTSRVASNWRVYNELARTRPDLVRTLAGEWVQDGFGRTDRPYTSRPLLYHQPATATHPERVIIQYARRSFTGFQALPRTPTIPPITEAQAEALDAVHFLAERFALGLDFQPGDVQYINNLATFHARDGFRDSEEQQRHLVRLWLRDPEYAWETPEPLKSRWDELYKGVTPEKQVFPLEPKIRSASSGVAAKTVSG